MFKNNRFSGDTHEEHLQRCELCAAGVATYDIELNFRPSWVADIADHADGFDDILNAQNIEDAEWRGAVTALSAARDALYELNASARWMVKTILDDPELPAGDKRLIGDAFDIRDDLTKGFFNLTKNTRRLLNGQEKLVDMGASWTLPSAIVANLTAALAEMEVLADSAQKEHGEKLKSTEDVYSAREVGENLLRNIFRWVVANWGDNDPRMLEFGFVPKSQIWTPGSGEPEPGGGETEWGMVQGLEVSIDPINNIYIKWKKVATAEKYTLLREVVPTGSTPPVLPYSVYKTGIPPLAEYCAYTDTDHDPGFAYYYSVVAINAVAEETEACPPKGVDYV